MGTRRLKKFRRKNKLDGRRVRRIFLLIAVVMTIVGFCLSKGSVAQFFKVFVVETIFILVLLCLIAVLRTKNQKGSGIVKESKKNQSSYEMNYESKYNNGNEHVKEKFQDRNIKNIKNSEKNYNWVIDDESEQSSRTRKDTSEADRKLVYAGKIISGEKKTMGDDDIKARVASWSEAVDYSGAVFRRIIEKTNESVKENDSDNTENHSQNAESIDEFIQEEKTNVGMDEKTNAEKVTDAEKAQKENKANKIKEAEILVGKDEEEKPEEMDGIWFAEEGETREDINESDYLRDVSETQETNKEKEISGTNEANGVEKLSETQKKNDAMEISGIQKTDRPEYHDEIRQFQENGVMDTDRIDGLLGMDKTEGENECFDNSFKADEADKVNHFLREDKITVVPPIDILKETGIINGASNTGIEAERKAQKLIDTLESFGVRARIINISEGPAVTRYELQPDYGVKVSKIVNLTDDIALNLAAVGVRIEAPIPGKAAIGIEIPNKEVTPVWLREVIESDRFQNHPSKLSFAVGKDIAGNSVVADIATMPHLLIAGATGSGKSVCINTLITSLLYKASPTDVKLLMVDPKVVELSIYNGIPHLLIPVVTDPQKAAGALNWAVQEMTNRYRLFAENNVRDIKGYNRIMGNDGGELLPQIVIIIDELADLMMVAPNDVEDCVCRLAQMARAAGMHLVIATQRPSVNVITGVIKANIPSRISFAVSSQVDSRTILDMSGAEKLLGKGDMLFYPLGMQKPVRVQGALITDKEVENIVSFIKPKQEVEYDEEIIERIDSHSNSVQSLSDDDDELLPQVVSMVIEQEQASTSLIQRKFKIGYARAARIVDQMEAGGIVGPFEGSKPRKVLITKQQWQEMK